jgi:Phage anti-repressor protein|nr:MAG TPA: antirepressor protein [Caudoviricetes sp.]DAW57261.1 MAG TPA: antirepressor protein [Caudoviricetes sp.]
MKELIKITEQNGKRAVSARELHRFLEVTERFSNWFERQLQYGFIEGVDYQGCEVFNTLANQTLTDYALTIDTAKEISMLQRTEKGKQARRYFIECEKLAQNPVSNLSKIDLAQMVIESEREKERLQIQNQLQSEELQKQAPKVAYYEEVLQSQSTYNTNQIAKELGTSAITLNKKLRDLGVQYKQGGTWLLYHKYQNKGYTKTQTYPFVDSNGNTQTSMQTVWTEEGRLFIHKILKQELATA